MAVDVLQKGKAAAEGTARNAEESLSATAETLRDLNITLIDLAHANIQSAFEFAREAANARTPSDLVALWSAHVPKQLALLNAQTKQLTELGQRLASSAAAFKPPQK